MSLHHTFFLYHLPFQDPRTRPGLMDSRKHAGEGLPGSWVFSPSPSRGSTVVTQDLGFGENPLAKNEYEEPTMVCHPMPLQSCCLKKSYEEEGYAMVLLLPPLKQPVERRVLVKPVIHHPDPSVYKLRGPKSSNTSVCLLTDFASQDNVTQEMKHMVFRSGSTALDVKAMDSKSNGALAWSNSINFECNSTFGTYAFYPSSEYSCDTKLVEKSFETDMNLNFQNLSVIALRILLLKVAGFNLLMTLRLWSS